MQFTLIYLICKLNVPCLMSGVQWPMSNVQCPIVPVSKVQQRGMFVTLWRQLEEATLFLNWPWSPSRQTSELPFDLIDLC